MFMFFVCYEKWEHIKISEQKEENFPLVTPKKYNKRNKTNKNLFLLFGKERQWTK